MNGGFVWSVVLGSGGVSLQRGAVQFYPETGFVHRSNDALFNPPFTVDQQIVSDPVDQGRGTGDEGAAAAHGLAAGHDARGDPRRRAVFDLGEGVVTQPVFSHPLEGLLTRIVTAQAHLNIVLARNVTFIDELFYPGPVTREIAKEISDSELLCDFHRYFDYIFHC